MTRRRRELTEAELALWQRVMVDAEPLPERQGPPTPPVNGDQTPPAQRRQPPAPTPGGRRAAALDPERPVDLDRRTWLRLKRGQVAIEQTLDLHGHTQDRAHGLLRGFLARTQAEGRRCVLIVTGKGEASGGVLRHMVPRWLNEGANRERVLAYCSAQRHHGGAGALYVLIRRRRRNPV